MFAVRIWNPFIHVILPLAFIVSVMYYGGVMEHAQHLYSVPLKTALSERYLSYALSTITARSLPDVRDGLKPVHRRLLYAMLELKLNPTQGYKKCARIVGDVMGKYHPHGDVAIYDAMVRLAQAFSVRYPLVDGQGNFGNIDGDNAAAMRYTEARLTAFASAMLQGIDQDTVDFRETYDGEGAEPVVLPSYVPNLLANGSSGIAVGMATNIPPHNVGEVIDALLYVIKTPNASFEKIMSFIKGPDFPTGGVLSESHATIVNAYATGRGSMRMRAKWHKQDLGAGLWQVVVTEIPYQVQKSRLMEKLAEIIEHKKVPVLVDVRDESAEDIRIVLEPRSRNVDAHIMMEALFKVSDLETRFGLNMNVLSAQGRVPNVLNIRDILQQYLDHRHDILVRRNTYRKNQIERRLHILQGYLIAFLNLDAVIRIIRTDDTPKQALMQAFELSDTQADAILNMRLRSLRKLEEIEIRKEFDTLNSELNHINTLLADESLRWQVIADELRQVKKDFGQNTAHGKRLTTLGDVPADMDIPVESMIEKEAITFVCSKNGWVRALKGHVTNFDDIKYKDNDKKGFVIKVHTTDKLLILVSSGKVFTLGCDKLPGGRGNGEPLNLMVEIPAGERVVAILPYVHNQPLVVASTDGYGFMTHADDCVAQTKNGKQLIKIAAKQSALLLKPAVGDMVAVIGTNRRLLIFPLAELPTIGRGRGVKLQKYKDAQLNDVKVFCQSEGLQWPAGANRVRIETELMAWMGKRASVGKIPPNGFPKNNTFAEYLL